MRVERDNNIICLQSSLKASQSILAPILIWFVSYILLFIISFSKMCSITHEIVYANLKVFKRLQRRRRRRRRRQLGNSPTKKKANSIHSESSYLR